jgi:hypothetical protein
VQRGPLIADVKRLRTMCQCSKLPNIFKLAAHPELEQQAPQIAVGNFVFLHRCSSCGHKWRIDAWDKYQVQFVVRVPEGTDWQTFDATELQKRFLVDSRGGLKDARCHWLGCTHQQVEGDVVYCVEHLYQTGARE